MSINNVKRLNSKNYKFAFTNLDGSVKDITGWKIIFTVKKSIDDLDDVAIIQVVVTAGESEGDDQSNGIMYVPVTSDDFDKEPDNYHYDFTRVIPGVTPDVKSMDSGTFDITKSVLENVV